MFHLGQYNHIGNRLRILYITFASLFHIAICMSIALYVYTHMYVSVYSCKIVTYIRLELKMYICTERSHRDSWWWTIHIVFLYIAVSKIYILINGNICWLKQKQMNKCLLFRKIKRQGMLPWKTTV